MNEVAQRAANGLTASQSSGMPPATRQRLRLSTGTELSFFTAGSPANPAVLLLHGTPHSSLYFRDVIPGLSHAAYVIAPDLPGFGESDVLPTASFPAYAHALSELLDHLHVGPRTIYLHDWGTPVGLHLAMHAPDRVSGLIIQNGNAHRTGLSPQWDPVIAYSAHPTPENEAQATAHLTFEGTRGTYTTGVPADLVARLTPARWEEDWRVMQLPGRFEKERALIADYGRYIAQFDTVADYLQRRQPPALLIWGRHDPFFELAEVLSWLHDLPRMEAHILDAGHLLLETHAAEAAALILDFITRLPSKNT
jgi:Predicted hydrolases or acyltransferases (alpha/beta hydrolase superfamily)